MWWYIIIGVVALSIGLLVGSLVTRWKHATFPLFENIIRQKQTTLQNKIDELEKKNQQLDDAYNQAVQRYNERIQELKRNIDEKANNTAALIKSQEQVKINEIQHQTDLKIRELEQSYKDKTIDLEHRRTYLIQDIDSLETKRNNIKIDIETWEHNVKERKRNMLGIKRMEREAELAILEHEYEARKVEVAEAIKVLQRTLSVWSDAERLAYEEREGRKTAEERNRLSLSDRSINELQELYHACGRLSLTNPLPLYKAIYDIYLKGPVKDLGIRIVCSKQATGIYKIWNVNSGKVYVGQSMDIAERWKQHIKRGTKCETGTLVGAGLYEAMWDEGIWNFRFEVLELCDKDMLGEREKFWIGYFQSNEIGYNKKL